MTDVPEVEVLTTVFPHPEGLCQANDRQTEYKVEELSPNPKGKVISYFAVNADYLRHKVAEHKQASYIRH